MISYTVKEIKALTQFCSKDETRFHLGGVYFKGDGNEFSAWATDGHTLVCAGAVPGDTSKAIFVPMADLARACKVAGATGTIRIVGGTDTVLRAIDKTGADTAIPVSAQDCESPPIVQVIPSVSTVPPARTRHVGVSPAYLARCQPILDTFGGQGAGEMRLQLGEDETDALLITVSSAATHPADRARCKVWTVVIMPLRLVSDKELREAREGSARTAATAARGY